MIEIKHVSRCFDENTAVDDVSFTIKPGEIIGLLGHNGAGKTTLMKMITGYLEPSAGEIIIDDKKVESEISTHQENIGYLPENLPLYPEMTVIDYLDYAAELRGVEKASRAAEIRSVIQKTELTEHAFSEISTLSRGYRQRVGVAQALLNNPKILILDEPTNGLDPSQTQHMRELIMGLRQHATVIVSTHIMQEVKAMCDRVVILRHGKLALDARLNELANDHRLVLKTDANKDTLEKVLAPVKAVSDVALVASDNNRYRYEIIIGEDHTIENSTAEIINAMAGQGQQVYAAEQVQFDLEKVFQDISDGIAPIIKTEGIENAA